MRVRILGLVGSRSILAVVMVVLVVGLAYGLPVAPTATAAGGAGTSELMFYRPSTGLRVVLDVDPAGGTTLLNKGTWSSGWIHVVPLELDGDPKDELLVYNATTGRQAFLDLSSAGIPTGISVGTWSAGWSQIVPVEADIGGV